MTHKSSWLIEKRVVLLEYNGNVDKAEIMQLNEDLENFLNNGESPIHIISDNRNMGNAELSIQVARDTFSAMKKPGWGWVILIGVGRLIRFFAEVFATQFNVKIKTANDLEEALTILKKLDMSLGDAGEV
jgi:hypothetical protein